MKLVDRLLRWLDRKADTHGIAEGFEKWKAALGEKTDD